MMNDDRKLIPDGTWPVMLTAFDSAGRIDPLAMEALIEWYLGHEPAGLFACCSSSEVYELNWNEKLQLSRLTVDAVAGRCPVIASPMGRDPGQSLADAVAEVYATGVAAVVLNLAELAEADEDDAACRASIETLLTQLPEVPLGLYECPAPYHRLAGDELLGWAAATGRFVFFKDTCCDTDLLARRLDILRGTPMRLFNAHTPLMLEALTHGAAGFCGIGTNFYPDLYNRLQQSHHSSGDATEETQAFLNQWDPVIHRRYPRSAKAFLADCGVPMTNTCRRQVDPLTPDDAAVSRKLAAALSADHAAQPAS